MLIIILVEQIAERHAGPAKTPHDAGTKHARGAVSPTETAVVALCRNCNDICCL